MAEQKEEEKEKDLGWTLWYPGWIKRTFGSQRDEQGVVQNRLPLLPTSNNGDLV